jgi:hypothetical protein
MILIDHDEEDAEAARLPADPRKRAATSRSPSPPPTPAHAQAQIGAMYSSDVGVLEIAAFPAHLRDRVPYPDGRPGVRPANAPFGREWTKNKRARQLVLEQDLLFHFWSITAAKVGSALGNYFQGGGLGDTARMEMLVSNALAQSTLDTGGGAEGLALLPKSRQDELREQFERAYDVGSEEFVRALQATTAEARRERAAAGVDRPVADAVAAMPWMERQRQTERAASKARAPTEAELAAAAGRPSLSASAPSVPTATATGGGARPTPLRAGPAPALMQVLVDEQARTLLGSRAQSELELRAARQRETLDAGIAEKRARAPEAPLSTLTPDGQIMHNITDKWSVLMYLLKKGPTETELKAWRIMYDEPDTSVGGRGGRDGNAMLAARGALSLDAQLATPEGRQKYLRDLLSVQKLLNSGQGGMDWVEAPQHTGVIFFTPQASAAVSSAMSLIHGGVVNKPWALEIDLMCHQRVRDQFSTLVAHYLQEGMSFVSSRFASTQRSDQERRRRHARLTELFRTLVMAPDGYLGFDGQINSAAERERRQQREKRVHYLETSGQYYSDARLG